jgi:hypothetical protein
MIRSICVRCTGHKHARARVLTQPKLHVCITSHIPSGDDGKIMGGGFIAVWMICQLVRQFKNLDSELIWGYL